MRDLAQRLLVESHRDEPTLGSRLDAVVANSPDPLERLHAAWTRSGITPGEIDAVVESLRLADEPALRAASVRMLERSVGPDGQIDADALESILELSADPDRLVRAQAVLSLGAAGPRKVAALAAMASRDGDDRFVRSAILNASHGVEAALLDLLVAERLVVDASERGVLDQRLRPVVSALGAFMLRGSPADAVLFLERISTIAAGQPEVAAWLVPPLAAHLRLDKPSPRTISLPRAPEGWGEVVEGLGGEMPQLAACDGRIDWPGKDGAAAQPPRRLAAEEQRRFAKGKRLFIHCMGCHGHDGSGMGGTYPPLDGSPIVLGDSGLLSRILLHGLEGPVTRDGVTWDNAMVKAPFRSNEDLAAVMTYIRRAWGNTADPVSPEDVAGVRRETAGRVAPWTLSELETVGSP